ncbi:glycosyltransferase [Deinococcus sp. KSM4-11]|nr:glycosyltransferase [Deinococcus sp. KSM4-11]
MLLAALLPRVRHRPARGGDALHFTFLIPALNEGRVIGATVTTLRTLAPDARVVVIDDGSDDHTAAVVQALAGQDSGIALLRRSLPYARRGKGEALGWATRHLLDRLPTDDLQREIFVVVDADGRITPDLLPEARAAMADPRVVGAQARVRIRPSATGLSVQSVMGRMLEQQQDLEFTVIRSVQRLRHRWHTVGLCGNGQFMRASYLHAQFTRGTPPWPDCLSEDFASGLEMRLASPEHRMVLLEAAVTQQGLPDLRRFLRQRARWAQGTLQCWPYLPRVWQEPMPLRARLDLSYYLLGPWLSGVVTLCLLSQPLRWALHTHGLILNPVIGGGLAVLTTGMQLHWLARYQHEQRLNAAQFVLLLLGQPLYGLVLSASLLLAYRHHVTGRRAWDKTVRHVEAPDALRVGSGD